MHCPEGVSDLFELRDQHCLNRIILIFQFYFTKK
jgi:hypothetical protein